MDRDRPVAPQLVAKGADRLDEGQRFDVADRPADLAQHEIEIVGVGLRERLDRVGDVRDHLHRRAQIVAAPLLGDDALRSEEHTSELQSLMRISYAVFCLKKKNTITYTTALNILKGTSI